ncbi:nucleotide-diphosphate-sugar epimerase [Actinorhabdospora filicis]|uniref:Nucleotide-diphosphate-sugar epimerase n=1 Tax=Actinorhabdospora filicis TaxID=1785913 RepID=A0A9W6SRK9_9ACTN|nr:NAD(P)H-binding protein [Actinorhabdospora filicis]GLZ80803.1 nucleotide-diphosphate-sugar epimerase [Actinorhabdospora filicis]
MYLITGATGNVGRHLVSTLVAQGAKVRAVTRDPAARFDPSVDVCVADPSDPSTVDFGGVTAAFLNSAAIGESCAEFAATARAAGVRRLVALAAYNIEHPLALQPSRVLGHRNRECEEAVVDSGLEWVSLRPGVYTSMALPLWGPSVRSGIVPWPYPDFAEPVVDPRDVAEVAAHALRRDDLLYRRPLLASYAVTHREMAAAVGDALGVHVEVREVSAFGFAAGFPGAAGAAAGAAAGLVASLVARWAALEDVEAPVTEEVELVLGRPARGYGDWARDHAGLF